jgi:hypothetical protein
VDQAVLQAIIDEQMVCIVSTFDSAHCSNMAGSHI